MTALVTLSFLVAWALLVLLVMLVNTTRLRLADRWRTRKREVPFAGSVEITAALPSLVAPQLGRAVREFHVSRWIRQLHGAGVRPSGVLTVDRSSGTGRLGWDPDAKSAQRGARAWQLDQPDIAYIRIRATVWDITAFVTVHIVDGAAIQLASDNPGPLRQALTDAGFLVVNGSPRESPSPISADSPSIDTPAPARSPPRWRSFFARASDVEQKRLEIASWQASRMTRRDEALRDQLRRVPPLYGQTRTWDELADYLGITPAHAWQLLNDAPPGELARLGLPRQPPHV